MLSQEEISRILEETFDNLSSRELFEMFNIYVGNIHTCRIDGFNGLEIFVHGGKWDRTTLQNIVCVANNECKKHGVYIFKYNVTPSRDTIVCAVDDSEVLEYTKEEQKIRHLRSELRMYNAPRLINSTYKGLFKELERQKQVRKSREEIGGNGTTLKSAKSGTRSNGSRTLYTSEKPQSFKRKKIY